VVGRGRAPRRRRTHNAVTRHRPACLVTRHVTRPSPVCPAQTADSCTFTAGQLRNPWINATCLISLMIGLQPADDRGRGVAVQAPCGAVPPPTAPPHHPAGDSATRLRSNSRIPQRLRDQAIALSRYGQKVQQQTEPQAVSRSVVMPADLGRCRQRPNRAELTPESQVRTLAPPALCGQRFSGAVAERVVAERQLLLPARRL
jgi:hypothetical protein